MDGTTVISPRSPGKAESAPAPDGRLARILEWPQLAALGSLLGLAALAWIDLVRHGEALCMAPERPWETSALGLAFLMWAVMMVAMMLPSAAPMMMIFATLQRRRSAAGEMAVPVALFVDGYVVVWTAWSALAAAIQWALQSTLELSMELSLERASIAGAVLIIAGLYQLTPLKTLCLVHCQSPMAFLLTQWRDGRLGALRMGIRHGTYCVGCCSALMALLFVVGVMDLAWVAALTAYVLLEKVVVWSGISRLVGVALASVGVWLMFAELVG
ncbi:MAG: DUF2182 domain-containing protein [Candidatus Binatia bacterium]